ncbi:MAG: RraA family protein [Chloroflexota bacterium]|nr:RraA family protein [Chloroflexota bacterium]
MIDKSVLDKLRQFDTATICNVIELFEVRRRNQGFMTREIKAAFPDLPPMVGFASTATCRSFTEAPDRDLPKIPDLISRFEDLSGPAAIVLQNLDSAGAAANFGDVFSNSFKAFGAVGLVTNGPGRDLEQIERIGFPVFYDGVVCAHGYMHLLDLHLPVQVGGLDVYPNDLLHGDGNGVTTIPLEIAADVADACVEYAAAEAVVIDLAQSGSASLQEMREAFAEMSRLVDNLGKRLAKS